MYLRLIDQRNHNMTSLNFKQEIPATTTTPSRTATNKTTFNRIQLGLVYNDNANSSSLAPDQCLKKSVHGHPHTLNFATEHLSSQVGNTPQEIPLNLKLEFNESEMEMLDLYFQQKILYDIKFQSNKTNSTNTTSVATIKEASSRIAADLRDQTHENPHHHPQQVTTPVQALDLYPPLSQSYFSLRRDSLLSSSSSSSTTSTPSLDASPIHPLPDESCMKRSSSKITKKRVRSKSNYSHKPRKGFTKVDHTTWQFHSYEKGKIVSSDLVFLSFTPTSNTISFK